MASGDTWPDFMHKKVSQHRASLCVGCLKARVVRILFGCGMRGEPNSEKHQLAMDIIQYRVLYSPHVVCCLFVEFIFYFGLQELESRSFLPTHFFCIKSLSCFLLLMLEKSSCILGQKRLQASSTFCLSLSPPPCSPSLSLLMFSISLSLSIYLAVVVFCCILIVYASNLASLT